MLGGGVTSRSTCEKAAKTRVSGSTSQTNGNCGVESVRQILNLRRPEPIAERALLDDAIAHGEAQYSSDPTHHGGATAEENVRTLTRYGVAARSQELDFHQIVLAVAEGRGVITTHEIAILWGADRRGRHAVLVAGLRYDDDGVLQSVLINDTGWGVCCMNVAPSTFERSLVVGEATVVTDHPIW
jgi:hypothetical protein